MTTQTLPAGIMETSLPGLVRFARGKVRDIYAVGDDQLLIVTTDRVSAFDAVMQTPIPERGKVLTQLSAFWFGQTQHLVPNHLLSTDVSDSSAQVQWQSEVLEGRSMLVRRTKRIDVECVARGYISGSAWSEYRKQGTACGIRLPEGLVESQQLPEPIFTPAIKADSGHDENISFERLVSIIGAPLAERLRSTTLAVYAYAAQVARERGIIIADTKMEFGLLPANTCTTDSGASAGTTETAANAGTTTAGTTPETVRNAQDGAEGELILIDELLTPDSSRFWDAGVYSPGGTPASFDKQYLRDWLEQSGWNKEPPAPTLPDDVVAATRERYVEALRRLTGKGL